MKARIVGCGWVSQHGAGRGREGLLKLEPGTVLSPPERRIAFANPDMRYGRLDDFSKLGLTGIALALQDAGATDFNEKRPIGLIAATRTGCSATDQAYFQTLLAHGGALASPNLFAYTLANCFLGEAAIRFGLSGGAQVLNEYGTPSLAALHWALAGLADGSYPAVISGYCELPAQTPEQACCLFLVLTAATDTQAGPMLERDAGNLKLNQKNLTCWQDLLILLPQLKELMP
ncbi:MAG: hypothetical protein Tsb0017_07370 [Geothermobacteraceae bacterium]